MAPDPARPMGAAGHRHRDGGCAGPCGGGGVAGLPHCADDQPDAADGAGGAEHRRQHPRPAGRIRRPAGLHRRKGGGGCRPPPRRGPERHHPGRLAGKQQRRGRLQLLWTQRGLRCPHHPDREYLLLAVPQRGRTLSRDEKEGGGEDRLPRGGLYGHVPAAHLRDPCRHQRLHHDKERRRSCGHAPRGRPVGHQGRGGPPAHLSGKGTGHEQSE